MAKTKIFLEIYFGRNRFRMVQNVFQKENLDFEKKFPLWLDIAIFSKNGVTSRNNDKNKKFFVEKKIFFWSESIQNGPKRILKRKSRFRKIFPLWLFSLDLAVFRKVGVTAPIIA